uniref:Uncharacterized protein n=1 Tax=uncultured Desulfobacterium sp. TaxID=201089 RepID=E1YD61_9BACT|nr:unknown protein [uncultured Desulfobacterium sp.]
MSIYCNLLTKKLFCMANNGFFGLFFSIRIIKISKLKDQFQIFEKHQYLANSLFYHNIY